MSLEGLRRQVSALPAGTSFTRDAVLELLGGAGASLPATADELLTAEQAAERLGVSVDWLYRRTGRLPFARKLSRRVVRYSAAGLAAYLAAREG